MLHERDYMQNGNPYEKAQKGLKSVYILLAVNIIMYLLIQPRGGPLYTVLALSPEGIKNLDVWQLVSSMFLHGGFLHILCNMWALYLFGTIIAPELGAKRFVTLYFISGITGSVLWLLFNWNYHSYLIGASGAVFGVLLATAMLYPDKQFVMLLFPVPVKVKTLVIVVAIIEVYSELSVRDNIAHLAHLGGFIAGYFYLKYLYKNRLPWDVFGFLFSHKTKKAASGWRVHRPSETASASVDSSKDVTQAELNMLLDKISLHGINSLSDEEIKRLRKAREQMRS